MDGPSHYHSFALRRGRVSISGQIYHITVATSRRQPHFSNLFIARSAIRVLQQAQMRGDAETLAYVLMPDHLHWLMVLGAGRELSKVVGTIKSLSSRMTGYKLWQQGFHDHAVRREERVRHIAQYIVANPLRAGLVARLGDYPHWDATWL